MSWLDQGRQQHGWFGHGTAQEATDDGSDDDLFRPDGLSQRISAVVYGAVAALPPALRSRATAPSAAGNLSRLTEVMPAWIDGDRLDQTRFADLFFGRAPDDPVVTDLRSAATSAEMAHSHADLRDATGHLAQAMQTIGLDRWPRFLADAQDRARDPATIAAVATSPSPPDYAKDAIRPVYPLETLLGVVAGGIVGGAAGAARVAGRAILRQIVPKRVRGLPPQDVIPPVRNPSKLRLDDASRPSEVAKGGKSLWDEQGGEWRYSPGDKWHNPHWDYNDHGTPNSQWQNVSINNLPPRK